jgi:hypothetical protein
MSIDEKHDAPDGPIDASLSSNNENLPELPAGTTESKLMWRIDLHVVPFLCVMYLLAFLGM